MAGSPPVGRGRVWWIAVGLTATIAYLPVADAQTRAVQSPLVTAIAGNQERTVIAPDIAVIYDSNVLRASDRRIAGPRDNVRVQPGLALRLNRVFGRIRATAAGRAGYDFNSRFGELDNARIDLGGSLRGPVGAICTVGADTRVQYQQFDLGDIDGAAIGTVRGGALLIQSYGLNGGCNRVAGFSPFGSVNYRRLTSKSRPLFDYDVLSLSGGVAYDRPSLGRVTVSVGHARIDRLNIDERIGVKDNTQIDRIEVSLERSVSPRLQGRLGGGYVRADPSRVGVRSFGGLSFNSEVTYRPVPRFSVTASATRDVQSQAGFNATYTIADDYLAQVRYTVTARSAVDVTFTNTRRRFRGEVVAISPARGNDTTRVLSGGYTFDFRRTLRAGIRVARRWRDSDNPLFDYTGTSAALTLGARF